MQGSFVWAERWRTVMAVLAAGGGLIAILACWIGVSGSLVVANQLSYIASGGLLGLFLLGVATLLFWAEQRDRELERLHRVETYLAAVAVALDLVDVESIDDDLTDGRLASDDLVVAAGSDAR